VVTRFDTMSLGVLAVELGAGRQRVDDVVDPTAGIIVRKKLGERVAAGESVAEIRTNRSTVVADAVRRTRDAIHIGADQPALRPTILAMVDRTGVHPWVTPWVD
jgi:pyrimidine-nucleoside phosphorylase